MLAAATVPLIAAIGWHQDAARSERGRVGVAHLGGRRAHPVGGARSSSHGRSPRGLRPGDARVRRRRPRHPDARGLRPPDRALWRRDRPHSGCSGAPPLRRRGCRFALISSLVVIATYAAYGVLVGDPAAAGRWLLVSRGDDGWRGGAGRARCCCRSLRELGLTVRPGAVPAGVAARRAVHLAGTGIVARGRPAGRRPRGRLAEQSPGRFGVLIAYQYAQALSAAVCRARGPHRHRRLPRARRDRPTETGGEAARGVLAWSQVARFSCSPPRVRRRSSRRRTSGHSSPDSRAGQRACRGRGCPSRGADLLAPGLIGFGAAAADRALYGAGAGPPRRSPSPAGGSSQSCRCSPRGTEVRRRRGDRRRVSLRIRPARHSSLAGLVRRAHRRGRPSPGPRGPCSWRPGPRGSQCSLRWGLVRLWPVSWGLVAHVVRLPRRRDHGRAGRARRVATEVPARPGCPRRRGLGQRAQWRRLVMERDRPLRVLSWSVVDRRMIGTHVADLATGSTSASGPDRDR